MDTSTPAPPAALVAKDPHWRNKVAKLQGRKPLTLTVTLGDDDAADAVHAARTSLLRARSEVRAEIAERLTEAEPDLSKEERAVKVEEAVHADERIVAAQQVVDDAEEAKADAEVGFEFRALPGDWWEALIGAHPPTEKQEGRGETYDVTTFAPALIAGCSLAELPATFDEFADAVAAALPDVMSFYPQLNQGEQALLFGGAVQVNQGARMSVGKGSRPTAG